MTKETAIKKQVRQYLRLKGWFVYHNLAGLGVHPGISDYTAIKNGQVVQLEIKTDKGRQSDVQKQFQSDWEAFGGEYYVIRSIDDLQKIGF